MGFESRISQFKNRSEMKGDEMRRRREDVTVEIRKQKREESMAKRRNLIPQVADDSSDSEQEFIPSSQSGAFNEQLPEMIQGVMSNDPQIQLEATIRFRKILSKGIFDLIRTQSTHCRSY